MLCGNRGCVTCNCSLFLIAPLFFLDFLLLCGDSHAAVPAAAAAAAAAGDCSRGSGGRRFDGDYTGQCPEELAPICAKSTVPCSSLTTRYTQSLGLSSAHFATCQGGF